MSILDALKTFKQERESLDDIAALPQALIMQMAQKGQIPKTDVPMILARKAEIAQTQAQMNALRQQQSKGAQPTLMEKMIAANAQQEAPQDVTDVGIASAEIPERQYAGGGIVAFNGTTDGSYVMSDEERQALEDNPYLQRSRGLANFFGNVFSNQYKIPGKVYESVKRDINESPESQAARFRAASNRTAQAQNPTQEVPATATASQRQAVVDNNKALADFDAATALFEKDRAAKLAARPDVGAPAGKGGPGANRQPVGKAPATEQPMTPREKLFAAEEKMLMDEREAAKGAREEAKWARLMEAGLNIMGGESPYAFTNIGKGAAAAAKGYGEDVKSLRAEERDRIKQLAALGAKREEIGVDREKLALTGKHYDQWYDAEMKKIGVMSQANKDDKMSARVNQAFNTMVNFYKARIDAGEINPSDLYAEAQRMVASNTGGAPAAPTSNTLSWSSLTGKK